MEESVKNCAIEIDKIVIEYLNNLYKESKLDKIRFLYKIMRKVDSDIFAHIQYIDKSAL